MPFKSTSPKHKHTPAKERTPEPLSVPPGADALAADFTPHEIAELKESFKRNIPSLRQRGRRKRNV